jgi:hypothetical protein
MANGDKYTAEDVVDLYLKQEGDVFSLSTDVRLNVVIVRVDRHNVVSVKVGKDEGKVG